MKRREFLRKGLALGTATMLPNVGISALPVRVTEPLMPIWEAAVGGHWNIVKEWLRLDPSLINVTGRALIFDGGCLKEELPLFHLAARLNPNVDFLKFLVSLGADVHTLDEDAATPLHHAAEYNSNVEVLHYLVTHGADVHAKNCADSTPLHYAAYCNSNVEIMHYLVLQGADVNATNSLDCTPLYYAISANLNVKVLQYLISQGADVNAKDNAGNTPLYYADTNEKKRILREAMGRV